LAGDKVFFGSMSLEGFYPVPLKLDSEYKSYVRGNKQRQHYVKEPPVSEKDWQFIKILETIRYSHRSAIFQIRRYIIPKTRK
jgi:hypothetical protein